MARLRGALALLRRRRLPIFAALAFTVLGLWLVLPYDSFVYLMPKYYWSWPLAFRISDEQVLSQPAPYPVKMLKDVVMIMKSGYGTRDRIQGWLDVHAQHLNLDKLLLTADFASNYSVTTPDGQRTLQMYDSVGVTLDGAQPPLPPDTPRANKYSDFRAALAAGDKEKLDQYTKSFGYELDAMKFISSLEMAYRRWPDEKWYIMADDDSYTMVPSAQRLIQQFDPSGRYYLGNPEGHWSGRFGHGGSNFMISQGAMDFLFKQHPLRVGEGHRLASTTAPLGDWLLAVTFNKIGLYVQEGHKRFFNGEDPWSAKIRPDRVCAMLVGFHGLKTGAAMRKVDAAFGTLARPATWWDVWDIMGEKEVFAPGGKADAHTRDGWDYVGRPDDVDVVTLKGDTTLPTCRDECLARSFCVSWSWESDKSVCHLSPWMTVGNSAPGKVSGLSVARLRAAREKCPKP